jgi:hypothetical protein
MGAVVGLARMYRGCVDLNTAAILDVMAQRPGWVEKPHAGRNTLG